MTAMIPSRDNAVAGFSDGVPDALDFVVIDVETACSRVSSICQVGIVGFRGGREIFAWESLVDPCDVFSSFNVRIHGIEAHHVADQPTFADLHEIVSGHLTGRVTVAHSYFDKGALAAACRFHDRTLIETSWLDSVRVAKRAWPHLESHRLGVLSRFLGLSHKHHDALSDARAAGMVIVKAIDHTGIDLAGWMAPSKAKVAPAPKPAVSGPLRGERAALLGAPRDGALARQIARAGGRVVSTVGSTTTMLVIANDHPFGRWVSAAPIYRKAEERRAKGQTIRILDEAALQWKLGTTGAPVGACYGIGPCDVRSASA